MLEFMDNATIRAVEADLRMGLDTSAGAMLLAQSDLTGPDRAAEAGFMATAFTEHGATEVFSTDDPDEGEQFTVARRAAFTSLGKTGSLLLEDVGVPLPSLPALVEGIETISTQRGVPIALVAHAGDGNTHPLIVSSDHDPARGHPPPDPLAGAPHPDPAERARIAVREGMAPAVGPGGTVTGQPGGGRPQKDRPPGQLGDDVMALTRRIKDALDPQGLL